MLGQSTSEYAYSPLRKASVRRGRTSGDIAAEVVREAEKAGGEISVLSRC
jgi:AmiR/NasT family two-component response regulator